MFPVCPLNRGGAGDDVDLRVGKAVISGSDEGYRASLPLCCVDDGRMGGEADLRAGNISMRSSEPFL